MALGALHGEMDKSPNYFSNQMPRTISPKPGYSLNYWRERNLWPCKRDVFQILRKRAEFRLTDSRPNLRGRVVLLDARKAARGFPAHKGKIKAIITSPPYFDVTNYEEDQWLRLWFLGFEVRPAYRQFSKDDRHRGKRLYWKFLQEVWKGLVPLVRRDAVLVCHIGANGIDPGQIRKSLLGTIQSAFPRSQLIRRPTISMLTNRQTEVFRPGAKGCVFEVDYVLSLGSTA